MPQKICFWAVFEKLLNFLESLKERILCLKSKVFFFLKMGYWY